MSYGSPAPSGYRSPRPLPPRQRASRAGLVVGIVVAIASVIILGLGAAAIALLGGPFGQNPTSAANVPSEADLTKVAQAYVDAVNRSDATAATRHMCNPTNPGVLFEENSNERNRGNYQWEVRKITMTAKNVATIDVGIQGTTSASPLVFEVRDGAWCVTA